MNRPPAPTYRVKAFAEGSEQGAGTVEALSAMIATKQVADDVRNSIDGRFTQPHLDTVPKRRRIRTALRWIRRQAVGASARNKPADFRSDQSPAGISC